VIVTEHAASYLVHGARKIRRNLHRPGHTVAQRTVERLMPTAGLRRAVRGRSLQAFLGADVGGQLEG